jgi:hypothetical protein
MDRMGQTMLARLFHPSEWFLRDDDNRDHEGGRLLYVYRKNEDSGARVVAR